MASNSSNIVKCNLCNIVINEVLAFVQNKISIMDEDTLVRLCETSFSEDEIFIAKKLLFESLQSKEMKKRRTDKSNKDLRDIFDLYKKADATDPEKIPIFVAKDLHRLPPVTFDHLDVTRLLRDIQLIQKEIQGMNSKFITREQVSELVDSSRSESRRPSFEARTYVNARKRDTYTLNGRNFDFDFNCDSGPLGLEHLSVFEKAETVVNTSATYPHQLTHSSEQKTPLKTCLVTENCSQQPVVGGRESIPPSTFATYVTTESSLVQKPPVWPAQQSGELSERRPVEAASYKKPVENGCGLRTATTSSILTEKSRNEFHRSEKTVNTADREHEVGDNNNEWTMVVRKKKSFGSKFIGSLGKANNAPSCRFKAAPREEVPLFISYVSLDTSEADIVEYIRRKTGDIVVLEKLNFKSERVYNSFKLMVPKHKVRMFLSDNIWPEGICFRKFVIFKRQDKLSTLTSKKANLNG